MTSSRFRSPARLGYRPALDGLRAVAVSLVILRHFAPSVFSGAGVVGVVLFFALSGFLITALLMEEYDTTGRISFRSFYRRRAARLVPAVVVLLLLYTVYAVVAGVSSGQQIAVTLLAASTYTTNVVQAAGVELLVDLGPLWSLAVEEQFYLLWPVALWLALRGGQGVSSRLLRLLASICLVAAFARPLTALLFGTSAAYTLPFTWVDAFAAGAVAAVLVRRHGLLASDRTCPGLGWAAAGATVVLAAASFVPELKAQFALYAGGGTILAAASAVLVAAAATGTLPGSGPLRLPPVVWWGRLSYSAYLYNLVAVNMVDRHLPELGLLESRGIAAAATVLLSVLSFYLVERPGQRLLSRKGSLPTSTPVLTEEVLIPSQRSSSPDPSPSSTARPAAVAARSH